MIAAVVELLYRSSETDVKDQMSLPPPLESASPSETSFEKSPSGKVPANEALYGARVIRIKA